jgi:hypothetical protein
MAHRDVAPDHSHLVVRVPTLTVTAGRIGKNDAREEASSNTAISG